MKSSMIYILMLPLLVLSACSKEEQFGSEDNPQPREALTLRVNAGDFATEDGTNDTRATDNGATTTFENGDRVGVIVLDVSGKVLADNVPYKYNGSSWAFDNNNTDSKNQFYYDNTAATYIVYYPYSSKADGVTNETTLKERFVPLLNQSTKEDYRASDLMLSTTTPDSPSNNLTVSLKHAYASIALLPQVKCTLVNGETLSYISSGTSNVSFTIGDNVYIPLPVADGSFRCIVSVNSLNNEIRCLSTYKNNIYSTPLNISGATANTRYISIQQIEREKLSFDKAQMGDFYCKSADGTIGYLIPGDVSSLTEAQKAVCLGVVLKAGRDVDGNWKDDCTYTTKGGADMSTIYGYVLALHNTYDVRPVIWSSSRVKGAVGTDTGQNTGFYGYRNTQIIKQYAKKDSTLTLAWDLSATYYATEYYDDPYRYPAPANSSGWFLPSAGQCLYWLNNKDALFASVRKAANNNYEWGGYSWSSSEVADEKGTSAWAVGLDGSDSIIPELKSERNFVRSILAF